MDSRKKLKNYLWDKQWSQRRLSQESGLPESYISYFLNGKFVLDKSQRVKIANVLGVAESEIFSSEEN
jgi:transcriptional regulator with XRE-family HTH domain